MTFSNITNIVIPEGSVSMIQDQGGNIIWQKSASGEIPEWYPSASVDWSQEYVQIVALDSGTITLTDLYTHMEYSFDGVNWQTAKTINVSKLNIVYIRQKSGTIYDKPISAISFQFYIRGNMAKSFTNVFNYTEWFANMSNLIGAKYLIIDYNGSFANYMCWDMFDDCHNLKTPPMLPKTELSEYCYLEMFRQCDMLQYAPELPATTLQPGCYSTMFQGCTSLEGKVVLPATTLVGDCYWAMLERCATLEYVKMLAIDYPSGYNSYTRYWMKDGASIGAFVKHINATWYNTGDDYVPANWRIIYFDPATSKYYLSDKTTECDENGNPI